MKKLVIIFLCCLFFIGISGNVRAQDDKTLYEQAESTFKSGNFDESIGLYQKYLDFYPSGDKIPDVQFRLAECSFQQRDFTNAAVLYEKVANLYPELDPAKQALSRAGESFQKTGDYANAKRVFTKLKNRYPDTLEADYAKYNLAELEKYIPSPKPATPTTTKGEGVEKPKTTETITEEELLQKGKETFEAKNYQQSIPVFKDFLKSFPKSGFAHYAQLKIAESFYYQQKFEEALKEYKKVVTDYPESKYVDYALYSIGWCNYRVGNDEDAISSFERLIKEHPDSKYVASSQKAIEKIKLEYNEKKAKELLSTAKSLYAKKKNREAKNNLKELIEKYPESEVVNEAKELLTEIDEQLVAGSYKEASAIYERGEKALKDKNHDEAIHEFKRVIFEFPESEYAKLAGKAIALIEEEKTYLLAKTKWEDSVKLYEEQKLAKAKEGFEEIVKEYPQTKYKEEAEEKLIELETKEGELGAYNTYKKALSKMQEKDYPEAINTFHEILTNYSNTEYVSLAQAGINSAQEAMKNERVRRKFDIARRYYELGDYKSAQGWFEDIKENYPDTEYAKKADESLIAISKIGTTKGVEGEYNLGIRFYEQGNLQEAIAQFKKVIDNYPNTKFAKAAQESLIIATRKLNDEQAKVLYDDARKFQGYGEYKFAGEQYDKLINEYPDSYWTVYAVYGKAEILYANEEFNKAKVEWQKVVDNFPASDLVPHALYHVAECYEQQGDNKKACSTYERLQKTYPESIYAQGELAELIKDKIVTLKAKE
ncbi:MAG: tetratricopeptide repeat protein [Nitrospirota bacterium]